MNEKQLNQRGMVSFTVTLIMMLVITLIVLGFSQVTRRNQREALDRQLSSQAFYAAESGVNVTKANISSYVITNGPNSLSTKNTCGTSTGSTDYDPASVGGNGTAVSPLDASANVKYTCVLVNPNPKSLIYDVSQSSSVVAPIKASGVLSSLTIQWRPQTGDVYNGAACGVANGYTFPPLASWTCGMGVVRIELMAAPNPAALSSAGSIDANTVVLYLTPYGAHNGILPSAGGNIAYGGPKAYVGSGQNCSTGLCQVKVALPGDSATYYARITSTYREAPSTTITGILRGSGAAALFNGSQAIVDVTGQAQDELRRVQVRVALTPTADSDSIPVNALSSSADICKHFSIAPTAPGDTVDPIDLCQ